jgi:hypothetical protein
MKEEVRAAAKRAAANLVVELKGHEKDWPMLPQASSIGSCGSRALRDAFFHGIEMVRSVILYAQQLK